MRGGRAVLVAGCPALAVEMHLPPDADVLHRPDPRHIAQRIGRVEVEDQLRLDQIARALADLERAPGRGERRVHLDLGRADARGQRRLEAPPLDARQVHARIVDQRRLVDRQVQALAGAQRDRRLCQPDFLDRRALVEVLLAVPFQRRDPPRRRRLGDDELGQFLGDRQAIDPGLPRNVVAEPKAVVEDPEHHVEAAFRPAGLGQGDPQFVVAVAHVPALAPGQLPGVIVAAGALADDRQVALELGRIGEQQAQARCCDDRAAVATDGVTRAAFVVGCDLDADACIRRGGACARRWFRGGCDKAGQRQQRDQESGKTVRHRAAPSQTQ